MKKILLITNPTEIESALQSAEDIIAHGGIVAFRTDTVYGIGASAFNEKAIAKLFCVKMRETNKSIAVLLADSSQAHLIAANFSATAQRLADQFWPGALTIITEKKCGLPANISPYPTIGVRIPDDAFARDLIRRCGPLAVTSANLSGSPAASCIEDFIESIGTRIDLILDGGKTKGGIASSVVDCTASPIKILRSGQIPKEQIESCERAL